MYHVSNKGDNVTIYSGYDTNFTGMKPPMLRVNAPQVL